jgi:hypothetical protein
MFLTPMTGVKKQAESINTKVLKGLRFSSEPPKKCDKKAAAESAAGDGNGIAAQGNHRQGQG